jgi:hypothetical protein
MQCILYKIYFWKDFSYVLQIDIQFICTPMWTKFYSCEKWVLHSPQPNPAHMTQVTEHGRACAQCGHRAPAYRGGVVVAGSPTDAF